MRLFVAVAIPEALRTQLASIASRVSRAVPGLSPARAEAMHVTLRFLGEVPPEAARDLGSRLAGSRLATPPFRAVLGGGGQFPSRGAPRVLYAAFRAGQDGFAALWREVCELTEGVGEEPPESTFTPHVTLARNRHARVGPEHQALRDLAADLAALDADVRVNGAALYESVLQPGGPRYSQLEELRCAP